MKYLVSAIVFILLFIVPAGSWYYLQSGLNYRKEALKDLEPKGPFSIESSFPYKLQSKTTLLQVKDIEAEVLPAIFDQYGSSETYQLFSLQKPSVIANNWKELPPILASTISAKYDGAAMILVDTSMQVRNIYGADAEGVTKMIEHTSIVLPRVKEVDIKMKKDGRK